MMQGFIFNQKKMTPEQAQQRMQSQQMQLAGNMPTDVSSGVQSIVQAMMARNAEAGAAFPVAPQAPAGATPMSLGTSIMNRMGFRRGGLY